MTLLHGPRVTLRSWRADDLEVLLSPSFELLIEWELFTLPQMWDKDAFIKNFLYFGEFTHQDSFEVIKNRNGKKGEFEMNPTREFFHKILIGDL